MNDAFTLQAQIDTLGGDSLLPAEKPARRRMIHRESAVQRGVNRAVKRAVAVDHEFACHDRGAEHNPGSHIFEKNRGYRRAWLDTEIALDGGMTFRCELKEPGWTPPRPELKSAAHWNDQAKMIDRLNKLGHPAAVATSVSEYLEAAHKAGVPLHPNWQFIGRHEDELVAADVRKQEAKRDMGSARKSKPFKEKASAGRIRRIGAIRSRTMF